MPRYKPRKMTEWEAADILKRAYDKGYARGLAGEPPAPPDPFTRFWGEWERLKDDQRQRGQRDGLAEFCRRVCAVKCGELPPPSPPPNITFDPAWQVAG